MANAATFKPASRSSRGDFRCWLALADGASGAGFGRGDREGRVGPALPGGRWLAVRSGESHALHRDASWGVAGGRRAGVTLRGPEGRRWSVVGGSRAPQAVERRAGRLGPGEAHRRRRSLRRGRARTDRSGTGGPGVGRPVLERGPFLVPVARARTSQRPLERDSSHGNGPMAGPAPPLDGDRIVRRARARDHTGIDGPFRIGSRDR